MKQYLVVFKTTNPKRINQGNVVVTRKFPANSAPEALDQWIGWNKRVGWHQRTPLFVIEVPLSTHNPYDNSAEHTGTVYTVHEITQPQYQIGGYAK